MSPLILAASVTLAWDPSPETDIMLYRLYIGIQPITETTPAVDSFPVSWPDTEFTVEGLDFGTDYWFQITAINQAGLESGPSNEVQYTPMPPPTPTPTPTPGPTPTPTPSPTPRQGWWRHNH